MTHKVIANNSGPRSNFTPLPGLTLIALTREEEMDAFDALGPLTKHVIDYEMGVPWSANETLKQIRKWGLAPDNPIADAHMASVLRQANAKILAKLAEEQREEKVA